MKALKENLHVLGGKWQRQVAVPMSSENLACLFRNEVPAISLPGFLSISCCNQIIRNLETLGMGNYSHVSHPVGRLGLAQMEFHLKNEKQNYFGARKDAEAKFKKTISGVENPIEKLMGILRHNSSREVQIATEGNTEYYFAGTYRNVKTLGHLHFDFAPFEAKGWSIENIESQLSWNLYLNAPKGGDLHVFDRQYKPEDEALRVAGDYYYHQQIVGECSEYTYSPNPGDIIIFNSRNFHEVRPVRGSRYTLSSFIGKTPTGDLVLWS